MSGGDTIPRGESIILLENTPEQIAKARRAVCGARACKDATEAKQVLAALGLYEGEDI